MLSELSPLLFHTSCHQLPQIHSQTEAFRYWFTLGAALRYTLRDTLRWISPVLGYLIETPMHIYHLVHHHSSFCNSIYLLLTVAVKKIGVQPQLCALDKLFHQAGSLFCWVPLAHNVKGRQHNLLTKVFLKHICCSLKTKQPNKKIIGDNEEPVPKPSESINKQKSILL